MNKDLIDDVLATGFAVLLGFVVVVFCAAVA